METTSEMSSQTTSEKTSETASETTSEEGDTSTGKSRGEGRSALYHVATGKVVAKYDWGNCDAKVSDESLTISNKKDFDNANHVNKLQMVAGAMERIWIRNDWHPQRCLQDDQKGKIRWLEVWSKSDQKVQWDLEFVEGPKVENSETHETVTRTFVTLKNVASGKYLSIDKLGYLFMSSEPDLWGFVPTTSAWSPGQAAALIVGGTIAVAGGAILAGAAAATSSAAATLSASTGTWTLLTGWATGGWATAAAAANSVYVMSLLSGAGVVTLFGGALYTAIGVCANANDPSLYVK